MFAFVFVISLYAKDEPKLGDISDGSRTTPVHIIKLIDQDSSTIFPDEHPLMPVSTVYTCSPCHEYKTVRKGWHFNAGDSGRIDGRKGHPWIYIDPGSATQLAVSPRGWEGTFLPDSLGFSPFEMIATFGRHLPGNAKSEYDSLHALENFWRWQVSGTMEINCMICHDAEPGYDAAEFSSQILRQNFRWAATAPLAYAEVKGTAKDLPDNYDIYHGILPDEPRKIPPTVTYDTQRFDRKSQVFMDLTRRIEPDRCYYCHSVKVNDPDRPERWHFDEDVHLKAGLNCVDCHRHGLDHNMVRGYEGEAEEYNNPQATSLSCAGCHLGEGMEGEPVVKGRLGAPYPEHRGLPPVHFERIACTTCHSGSWPKENALNVKTSIAHGLGMHSVNKSETALPHVQGPVFARTDHGKITPHYLFWPAYWGQKTDGRLHPLEPDKVVPVVRSMIGFVDSLGSGNWPVLSDSVITAVLDSLVALGMTDHPVYVTGGYSFSRTDAGTLIREKERMAEPYMWPLAHDVRPASQSLGINGCNDCHTTDADLYFGEVSRDAPVAAVSAETLSMYRFMDVNPVAAWIFSFSFLFRPLLKFLILFGVFIITVVLIYGGFQSVNAVIHFLSPESSREDRR